MKLLHLDFRLLFHVHSKKIEKCLYLPTILTRCFTDVNCFISKENERSRDIIIESKFHRSLIGPKGEGMQDIRKKFPDARISFPEAATKSDVVNIRGPKDQVDAVYAQLKKKNAELIASNYHIDVPIFKKFHRNIIGRGGVTIKKVII